MSKTEELINSFRNRGVAPSATPQQKVEPMIEAQPLEEEKTLILAVDNPPPSADLSIAEDSEADYSVYGSDRTKRQKNMISLVMLDNRVVHLPYNQIMFVDVQHSKLLSIYAHFGIISITGKGLDLIAQRLKHGSLSYINEGGKTKPPQTPDGVCVYSITVDIVGRKTEEE
jgi:hypothetical protein